MGLLWMTHGYHHMMRLLIWIHISWLFIINTRLSLSQSFYVGLKRIWDTMLVWLYNPFVTLKDDNYCNVLELL